MTYSEQTSLNENKSKTINVIYVHLLGNYVNICEWIDNSSRYLIKYFIKSFGHY